MGDTKKEYYKAIKQFKETAMIAVVGAKRGLFAPEAIHILKTKHAEINELMTDLSIEILEAEIRELKKNKSRYTE